MSLNTRVAPRLALALLLGTCAWSATVMRIACGGPTGGDALGNVWQTDTPLAAGGGPWTTAGKLPKPYSNLRYSSPPGTALSFTLSIPAGSYIVTLKFVEPNATAAGQRIFSATINGAVAITNLDLFAAAGALVPFDLPFPVTVTTGTLAIVLAPSKGNAVISGIQVDAAAPAQAGLVPLSGFASARPATCPAPAVITIYASTDTPDIWFCTPSHPWVNLNILAPLASIIEAGTLGMQIDPANPGVMVIGPNCTPQTPCNARIGNTLVSITSSIRVTLGGAGSDTVWFYIASDGTLTVASPLLLTCDAPARCIAVDGPMFPPGSISLWTWTVTSGAWNVNGRTDRRAFLSRENVTPGFGLVSTGTGLAVDVAAFPQNRWICFPFLDASTTWTVPGATHRLGTSTLIAVPYDSTGLQIQPDSIRGDPATFDITVTFAQPQRGCLLLR